MLATAIRFALLTDITTLWVWKMVGKIHYTVSSILCTEYRVVTEA